MEQSQASHKQCVSFMSLVNILAMLLYIILAFPFLLLILFFTSASTCHYMPMKGETRYLHLSVWVRMFFVIAASLMLIIVAFVWLILIFNLQTASSLFTCSANSCNSRSLSASSTASSAYLLFIILHLTFCPDHSPSYLKMRLNWTCSGTVACRDLLIPGATYYKTSWLDAPPLPSIPWVVFQYYYGLDVHLYIEITQAMTKELCL